MKKHSAILSVILIVFIFSLAIAADLVEFDAKKHIVYIDDASWDFMTVPYKEKILANFGDTLPGHYWDVRLLRSGLKVGEIYPTNTTKWKLILPK